MLSVLDESTVIDEEGRFLFLSEKFFTQLTNDEDRCFVCLTAPGNETREHIVPNWVIRLCGLSQQSITLGNGSHIPYPKYTVPCCENCNQLLQKNYEDSISKAFKGGICKLRELHDSDPTLLLRWLNLLFFKTHYKDLFLRRNLDTRKGDEKIGDIYDWGVMNLPHTLFRVPINGVKIESAHIGSLCVMEILNPVWAEVWDYRDDFRTGTVYVRIGDVALIGVLNDGGFTDAAMQGRFCIDAGAYVAQSMEVLTDYQVFNQCIRPKPEYIKRWVPEDNYTGIRVDLPKNIELDSVVPFARHALLWRNLKGYEALPMDDGRTLKDAREQLMAGKTSLALNPHPKVFPTARSLLRKLRKTQNSTSFYYLN